MTPKMLLDLGTKLARQGDWENAITAFCSAIKLAPRYSPAYNNLGLVLKNTNRRPEAAACFGRALELNPGDPYAYNNLGLVLMEAGNYPQAETCFRRAVKLNPHKPAIHNNLGTVLEATNRRPAAAAAYRRALELNPDYPEAHYNLGTLLRVDRQLKEAEDHLRRAVALRPAYFEANFSLATLHLLEGEFGKGWKLYEKSRRKRTGGRQLKIPSWRGEDLTGRRILLCWEYGFGDTIQFARYVRKVEKSAGKISLWVQKPLKRLLAATYPELSVYAGDGPPPEQYDYVCSLLSLPAIFNTGPETIPPPVAYKPDLFTPAVNWAEAIKKVDHGDSYRVGLVWAGHPKHLNNANRSIPFTVFRNLFTVPGVGWVSLQVGPRAEDLTGTSARVSDFSRALVDFRETASLIENLDLVITVDTAVAHLAGTMGKKTWILLSFDPDWRWQLDREDSPWYPAVRLFRQRKPGDWPEVMESVKTALSAEVKQVISWPAKQAFGKF